VQPFTIWLQLRNGNGEAAMALVMEYLPPADLVPVEIATVRFTATFTNPNHVVEHEAILENLRFENEGRYRLRLLADGVPIMVRDFVVVRKAK